MPLHHPPLLIRPLVRALHPYVPGEQPKIKGLIKLNTNENPYPPSPSVLAATRAAVDGRLRLYPNPTAQLLREKLARLHGCRPENIIVGNGSDELLALAVRTFVEPIVGQSSRLPLNLPPESCRRFPLSPSEGERAGERGPSLPRGSGPQSASSCRGVLSRATTSPVPQRSKSLVQFFTPSYSLYPVLADIHGAARHAVPLSSDFTLPSLAELKRARQWDFRAALTFVTTPNAPSGRGYRTAQLEELCRAQNGVVVLDEAYVDFARDNAMPLALKYPHVLVARTFSKAYSLCFQRIGYCVGHPELIAALHKIRDSYNVNGLGQVAALATLDDLPRYRATFRRIIATREQLSRALDALGFRVFPSQTNFILVRPPKFSARTWLRKLRDRKILVRWFSDPLVRDYLRITIGTPAEAAALVKAAKAILRARPK
ncbi:MAG: aminotransferase class I/II-fold pyridoxal phosphate-dependent enzyme [Verrucomicrobiota bacterium]|jgi:histidinol-phosphate aminotransferase